MNEKLEASKCYESPRNVYVLFDKYTGDYITDDGYSRNVLQATFFETKEDAKNSIFYNENTKIALFMLQYIEEWDDE